MRQTSTLQNLLMVAVTSFLSISYVGPAGAQESSLPGPLSSVSFSGFGDIQLNADSEERAGPFQMGQAEIGLEATPSDHVAVALAFAYDQNVVGIGSFTIEYRLASGEQSTDVSLLGIDEIWAGVGQFDVPFGIDYRRYASVDRRLISTPAVVEQTHGCWNDLGGYVRADASAGNLVLFASNGSCHEDQVDEHTGEPIVDNALAVGGRLGIKPVSEIEGGLSYAHINAQDGELGVDLLGIDFQAELDAFAFRSEYIEHRSQSASLPFLDDGWYAQLLYEPSSLFVVARVDHFYSGADSKTTESVSFGSGYWLNPHLSLRGEYTVGIDGSSSGLVMQVVAWF